MVDLIDTHKSRRQFKLFVEEFQLALEFYTLSMNACNLSSLTYHIISQGNDNKLSILCSFLDV